MRIPSLVLGLPPVLALGLVLVACGGGGGGGGTPLPPVPGAPYGLEERAPLDGLRFPVGVPEPQVLGLERAFDRLTFSRPVALATAPDAARDLYVVEQDGRILVFEADEDVGGASTFLDIRDRVSRGGNEEGLLGLAFDPDFGTSNGTFWVHYSAASPRRSVLARFEATFSADGLPSAAASTEVVVLQVPQPYSNHNGGGIVFGPDDMLYVGFGDGGSGNDPDDNGQDRSTLLGAMLRLDVRGQATYAIPSDNPFVGVAGARAEIWAYGLRNPWRFTFDRETGALWVGDVGQGAREEITIVDRGENHGWPVYEGDRSNRNPANLPPTAFVRPVIDYPRSDGTSVIGGLVVRGNALPSLRGAYVYGDYGSGRVWALVREGDAVRSNTQVQSVSQLVSFGEDDDGNVYAVSLAGTLWRFVEIGDPPPTTMPDLLSETGLFADTTALRPNAGLIEYDVNSPLWSDGAEKRRWIGLPGTTRIGFREESAWAFPTGTVLVKHFEIALGPSSPRRRLETRVLLLGSDGWRGATYRWNEAGTDAVLLLDRATETLEVEDPDAPGGVRLQRYDYPSRTDCFRCHTEAAGFVLGVNTRQINRAFEFPRAQDNQLRTWNHIDLFDGPVPAAETLPALDDPSDGTASIEVRARSYLDANCAFCHQPTGPAPGTMDLRVQTAEAAMGLIDVRPTEGNLGLDDAWRVRAGVPAQSVLWERMRRLDDVRMPPLSSHVVDDEGVELIRQWITTR